jgi:hypothetical protein
MTSRDDAGYSMEVSFVVGYDLDWVSNICGLAVDECFSFVANEAVGVQCATLKETQDETDHRYASPVLTGSCEESPNGHALVHHHAELWGRSRNGCQAAPRSLVAKCVISVGRACELSKVI